MINQEVIIDYTNYRGERGMRTIRPMEMFFGLNDFHPGEQWLLKAIDVEKNAERVFAMKDIHSWTPKS
jgi:predicted DNA-binding transcriptional regulator YafY